MTFYWINKACNGSMDQNKHVKLLKNMRACLKKWLYQTFCELIYKMYPKLKKI